MRTLIIHPKDSTTNFLKPIYARIKDKTVVSGGINKTQLRRLIEQHDRTILLGHGYTGGLLSVGQFQLVSNYLVDWTFADLLSKKSQNIYIWCHADQFVQRHDLQGFCSGMFISEVSEAYFWGFKDCDPYLIEESNIYFAEIVARNINNPLNVLYKNVIQEYGPLAKTNQIAQFNLERLSLSSKKRDSVNFHRTVS